MSPSPRRPTPVSVLVRLLAAMSCSVAFIPALQAEPRSSSPRDMVTLGGVTLFVVTTVGHPEPFPEHTELARTDGTPEGTFVLRTCTAECNPRVAVLTASDELLFFTAYEPDFDWQVWRTDGTPEGTRRLTDLRTVGFPPQSGGAVWNAAAGRLFFAVEELAGWAVWSSDGSAPGTRRLAVFPPPVLSAPFGFTEHAGAVWFFVSPAEPNPGSYELWRSDGTPAGTGRLTTVPAQLTPFEPGSVASLNHGLAFVATDPTTFERNLWVSDGSDTGTAPLALGNPDFRIQWHVAGGIAWLWSNTAEHGRQLWRSDGSAAGTVRLTELPFGSYLTGGLDPWPWRGGVVFSTEDRDHGFELWASDGSPAGTGVLLDLCPGPCSTRPVIEAVRDDRFFFRSLDPVTYRAGLWASDGTAAGTGPLVEPPPGFEVGSVAGVGEERIYYTGAFDDEREQLWVQPLDGGPAQRLTELRGLVPFGYTRDWSRMGEALVFAADEGVHGIEPWVTDGTPQGTRLLADLAPGGDGFPSCQAGGEILCLGNGRFRVTVTWRNQRNGDTGSGRAVAAAGSERSGYFWFFRPDNVELIVKVLDGTSVNGFHWTFYGALTDVEYTIAVTDTVTGESRSYHNPPGEICGRGDTSSLAGPASTPGPPRAARPASPVRAAAHPSEPCREDARTLCLLDGRFQVRVVWEDQHNQRQGEGGAIPFGDRTGLFWFFNPQNIELVVKILDGTPVNGRIWVFYGALSNVGYTLEVVDTGSGDGLRRYVNPPGNICGGADTAAF